jgi:uncharacterized protein (DUF2062 family)
VKAFLHGRLVAPLKAQLTQGVTPGRLALALSLGIVLGLFPVLGVTTLLCGVVAAALKLNQPAVQVANFAAYPVQLALFVPFFHAGARLFGQPPLDITVKQLRAEVHADRWGTIVHYAGANLRAVAAWALVAPLVAGLLYVVLKPLLHRVTPLPPSPPEG